jgi:hypothetical protein
MKTLCFKIGLSLLLVSNVAAEWPSPEYRPKPLTDEEIISKKESFKDSAKLKVFLMGEFATNTYSGGALEFDYIRDFKRGFEIRDEIIRSVLLDIYRESIQKTEWRALPRKDIPDDDDNQFRLIGSILWMSAFADDTAKNILRGIATDRTKDEFYRFPAILSYLRCADAQETKDFLAAFLAEKTPFLTRYRGEIEHQAQMVHREADEQKREVIDAALTEIKKRGENKPTPWKLSLLISTLILGGVLVAWHYFRKRRRC